MSAQKISGLCRAAIVTLAVGAFLSGGCVGVGGKAIETHRKGIEGVFEEEYFVPKKPVDRHYIGLAWSKQFGPVEDPLAPEIRVKKERSLNTIQQDFAYSLGLSLGGESIAGSSGKAGLRGGGLEKTKMEGVEIISPVSLADIPFEPNVPYVTEALRLANFRIKAEKSRTAEAGLSALPLMGKPLGAAAEAGGQARGSTEGEGLVVAYKMYAIDRNTYDKQESGGLPLELGRSLDIPKADVVITARLQVIEPGTSRSLPRNLLWACPRADALSKDMVAAWLVDIRPMDPMRKSLMIAFPGFPEIEDCRSYSGVIFSRIDPATDRIIRQKIRLVLVEADLSDSLQPTAWVARVSVTDESFKVRLVRPYEIEGR